MVSEVVMDRTHAESAHYRRTPTAREKDRWLESMANQDWVGSLQVPIGEGHVCINVAMIPHAVVLVSLGELETGSCGSQSSACGLLRFESMLQSEDVRMLTGCRDVLDAVDLRDGKEEWFESRGLIDSGEEEQAINAGRWSNGWAVCDGEHFHCWSDN